MMSWEASFVLLAAVTAAGQGQQQPQARVGWPCVGRPDPTYFRIAEASGGQVFLFDPSEIGESSVLMLAGMRHEQTVYRVAGSLTEGLHTFTIPVDSTIESLLVSVSLQCLQVVEIAPPSGAPLRDADPGVDYHHFEAGRIVVVERPVPGAWTVTVSGRGLFFLVVQARSPLALGSVRFMEPGGRPGHEGLFPITGAPKLAVQQWLEVGVTGAAGPPTFSLISAFGDRLQALALAPEPGETGENHTFHGQVTPRAKQFRVAVTGVDARGYPFQRVHAPLYSTAGAE
jgi:hypothetical protein